MNPVRSRGVSRLVLLLATAAALATASASPAFAGTTQRSAQSAQTATIDPSDPRLVPNPIEASDEGTVWTCRFTGPEVQCDGVLQQSWPWREDPENHCAVPLYSINGTFTRTQTRYYRYDAATGRYLEYKRLIHLTMVDSLTTAPDPSATNVVDTRLVMTWTTTFQTPGDLDSRVTRKQGIDTFIKDPHGGIVVLDVGQKTTILSDDFDFRGRWDIALGDPEVEFGKICNALGV